VEETAVRAENISKIYRLYNDPKDRMKEALHPFRKKYHHDFYALNDISFEIKKGETVGIIGRNGSGKSTLLKILTGVLTPTGGNILVHGKISALLELGAGFNPELSGIENVYFNGAIMGYTSKEMDSKLDDILSFADIGEFVHQPVKTYSSGMFVRLAFSVATSVDPDILIIDEALSVGDSYFQLKSMNRMKSFMDNGKTVLFVSHDPAAVKTLCKRGILLEQGHIIKISDASSVIDYYNNLVINDLHKGETGIFFNIEKNNEIQTIENDDSVVSVSEENTIVDTIKNNKIEFIEDEKSEVQKIEDIIFGENSIDTGEVELLSVQVLNSKNNIVDTVISEEDIKIVWKIRALKDFDDPHYGIRISNRLGIVVFEIHTYGMKVPTKPLNNDSIATICFDFKCNLFPENYSISLGFANKGYNDLYFEEYILLAKDVKIIRIIENLNSFKYSGYYNLNPNVSIAIG